MCWVADRWRWIFVEIVAVGAGSRRLATQPWYGSGKVYTKSDLFDLRLHVGKKSWAYCQYFFNSPVQLFRLTSLSFSLFRVSIERLTLIRPRDLNLNLPSSCITRVHFYKLTSLCRVIEIQCMSYVYMVKPTMVNTHARMHMCYRF